MSDEDRGASASGSKADVLRVSDLKMQLRARSAVGFRKLYPVPALVTQQGRAAAPSTFVTQWATPGQVIASATSDDPEVYIVVKKEGAAYADRIGLGRAANVDIPVRRDGISKFHAFFIPHDDQGQYEIGDAGSKNGTFVDDVRLLNRTPVALPDGATVRFGTESFLFLMPDSLIRFLSR